MIVAFQIVGYVAAVCLQVMILLAMRGEGWRRYPFVFIYVLADLATNLIEIQPNLGSVSSAEVRRRWVWIYYWDERVIQALLFILVISLIYRASSSERSRRTLLLLLILGSLTIAGLSLFFHYDPNVTTGKWMTRWTRDMNFTSAILDLLLWATLLRSRRKDQTTLMISGALGLQFTAGAISQALRDISHTTVEATGLLIVAANLTCLYIWWQAFRTAPHRAVRAVKG